MVFFCLLLVLFIVIGLFKIFGAESRMNKLEDEVDSLRKNLYVLQQRVNAQPGQTEPTRSRVTDLKMMIEKAPRPSSAPSSMEVYRPPNDGSQTLPKQAESKTPPRNAEEFPPTIPAPVSTSPHSVEMVLGTKWLNWVGMVMLLFGVGYFMKYAYDNAWIGPKGRLSIGVIASFVALVLGERFRRRDWALLFQVFTGGAIAGLYLCVYFSFQVYHLSGQGLASFLAVFVTVAAIALAVVYDAVAIEILALVGGFLSPVLLSTGENHPYLFFGYITMLNLVALATAIFRRWRVVDSLCLAGTVIMYLGWTVRFYGPDQMQPALIFTSIFYLMFLLIPTIYGLVNRLAQDAQGMMMILAACVLSFISYFSILYPAYRYSLSFVTITQALLVFLLFYLWIKRVGSSGATGASLLSIALGLVTLAVPIQLELYGIPLAWAMEGAVLTYVGIRLKNNIPRIAGLACLGLSTLNLFYRLPLHSSAFIPVFNAAFGSWIFVLISIFLAAFFWQRYEENSEIQEDRGKALPKISMILAVAGISIFTLLLNLEIVDFWRHDYLGFNRSLYQSASLLILWVIFSVLVAFFVSRKIEQGRAKDWVGFSALYYCGALVVFFFSVTVVFGRVDHSPPFVNIGFASCLAFVLSLAYGGVLYRRTRQKLAGDILESAAHIVLAMLLALELYRWGSFSSIITQKMSINLISVAWAFQAFSLILIGLAKNKPLLRYLGFGLFAISIGKILLIDTSKLEKVYRTVSFIGCGLLLVAAGYFYQRYSAKIMEHLELEKTK